MFLNTKKDNWGLTPLLLSRLRSEKSKYGLWSMKEYENPNPNSTRSLEGIFLFYFLNLIKYIYIYIINRGKEKQIMEFHIKT